MAVSLDDNRERWVKAIKDDGLIWPNVSELNGDWNSAALLYGVTGIPDNFLIDRNGRIIDRNLQGKRLRERLSKIFEE
jgi:hypothetical protein